MKVQRMCFREACTVIRKAWSDHKLGDRIRGSTAFVPDRSCPSCREHRRYCMYL